KRADLETPPGGKDVFPVFRSPSLSPSKCKSKLSPGSSPSRKRSNLTLKQGASQNNKILRYLQPKRLLNRFEAQDAVSVENPCSELENKENKIVNGFKRLQIEGVSNVPYSSPASVTPLKKSSSFEQCLDVKVVLVKVDDHHFGEHSYCMKHLSPRKHCCKRAAECVAQAVDKLIDEDINNPCQRLGIPSPICLSSYGCNHFKEDSSYSAYQENLYSTMVDVDLPVAMLRACCQELSSNHYPSPALIHSIFALMKKSSDQRVLALGKSYLKRALDKHPPCNPKMRGYYIHILNSSVSMVKIPSGLWGLRNLEFFESILGELESHIEKSLDPKQLQEKMKVSGVRKKTLPARLRQSPSPLKKTRQRRTKDITDIPEKTDIVAESCMDLLSEAAVKKRLDAEEALEKMADVDKTSHIFDRFETLVDILEWDLVVWLAKDGVKTNIRDRTMCPLVVLALWRPEADTGFDSSHCRRIFSMYGSAWILNFHPRHLKTLARFIGLIAEVTRASEPNFGNVYPSIGDGCENLARKLSEVLGNPLLGETRTKALAMIKPEWLKMLTSSNLLNVSPTLASLSTCL
ncbi:tRNA pseudouridine synthase A, partial [Frankliniella fusca]